MIWVAKIVDGWSDTKKNKCLKVSAINKSRELSKNELLKKIELEMQKINIKLKGCDD